MTVNVLILEDNPVARGLLGRVVRESFIGAHLIAEAGDVQSARRHLAQAGGPLGRHGKPPFNLVLLDLDLPHRQGLALLDELASYPAVKIVTALFADEEPLFSALQRGADGYLLKDARFAVLVEELQKTVRGQPPLSPALARRLLAHFQDNGAAKDPTAPQPGRLSKRDSEVLACLSKGFTVKEIASHMGSKASTVYDHIRAVYRQVKAPGRDAPASPGLDLGAAGKAP